MKFEHQFTIVYIDTLGREMWPTPFMMLYCAQAIRCIHCGADNSGVSCRGPYVS